MHGQHECWFDEEPHPPIYSCRICYKDADDSSVFISPCKCTGCVAIEAVHLNRTHNPSTPRHATVCLRPVSAPVAGQPACGQEQERRYAAFDTIGLSHMSRPSPRLPMQRLLHTLQPATPCQLRHVAHALAPCHWRRPVARNAGIWHVKCVHPRFVLCRTPSHQAPLGPMSRSWVCCSLAWFAAPAVLPPSHPLPPCASCWLPLFWRCCRCAACAWSCGSMATANSAWR